VALRLIVGGLLAWGLPESGSVVDAGSVQLKNGVVIEGRPAKLLSLDKKGKQAGMVPVHHIVLIDDGWRRYYVPQRQVPDTGLDLSVDLRNDTEFTVPQLRQGRGMVVQSVGGLLSATPFDTDFGRRTVTLATPTGPLPVVQGIAKLTPDHVWVQGLTHVWEFGLGLNVVPQETIRGILNNPVVCDPENADDRLARARFYIHAGWYPQAFAELDQLAQDFPDLAERVSGFREELSQLFGGHVLRELKLRQAAGQYELADESIRKLPAEQLGAAVTREVRDFLAASAAAMNELDRIPGGLGDLQAQLTDEGERARVSAVRAQLVAELDRAGLDRLRPFLQAANDDQLGPGEKLALAFSGWVTGTDDATTDLGKALRLWEARDLVREYLRSDNPVHREELFAALRPMEGIGTATAKLLIRQLPPVLDAETIAPGTIAEVTLPTVTEDPPIAYRVMLPPEYSPRRLNPLLVVLRPEHKTTDETIAFWAGTAESPGWAARRGYIVIAPEYLPADVREYPYSAAAQTAILRSLRDARLRFAVDPDRVFLTGHDMGGDAAFDVGFSHPDEFAGVLPIGGVSEHYGRFEYENGQYTAWYVVRGELGRDGATPPMAQLLDRMFIQGAKFDLIYLEFPGRGRDAFQDTLPQLFDWMDLHVRRPIPNDFEYRTLRQCADEPFGVTARPLPRTYLVPATAGGGVDPMKIEVRYTTGNSLTIQSPADHHTVRLYGEQIDFDRKLTIRINGKTKFAKFVTPDLESLLENFRLHGDRTRLAEAVLEF
jgi:pimeloyl-ACP methyl ester carboxylesterase